MNKTIAFLTGITMLSTAMPALPAAAAAEPFSVTTADFTAENGTITITKPGCKANFLITGIFPEENGTTDYTAVRLGAKYDNRGWLFCWTDLPEGQRGEVGDLLYLSEYMVLESYPPFYQCTGDGFLNYGKADKVLGTAFRDVIRHEQALAAELGNYDTPAPYLQTVKQYDLDKNDLSAVQTGYEVWGDTLQDCRYAYAPCLGIVPGETALTEAQIEAVPGYVSHQYLTVSHADAETARYADLPDGTQVLEVQVRDCAALPKAIAALPEDADCYLVETKQWSVIDWYTGELRLEISHPEWIREEDFEGLQEQNLHEENGRWYMDAKIDPAAVAFSGEDKGGDARKAIAFAEGLQQEHSVVISGYTLPGEMDLQALERSTLQKVIRTPEKNWEYYWNLDDYSVYREFTETCGIGSAYADDVKFQLPPEKALPFYNTMRWQVDHTAWAEPELVYWVPEDAPLGDNEAAALAEQQSYFGFPDAWHLDNEVILEQVEYPDGGGYTSYRDLGCHVVRPQGANYVGTIRFRFDELEHLGTTDIPVFRSVLDVYRLELTLIHSEFAQDHIRRDDNGRYRIEHPVPTGESGYSLKGDPNEDGVLNASDAAVMLIEAARTGAGGDSALTEAQNLAADVNGDGTVNASDASLLLIYAAELGAGNRYATLSALQ